MLTTIVIAPRERFSSLPRTLRSLFKTVPADQPVIVVEGATPSDIRDELNEIKAARPFEHIALPYPLLPNAARNIGAAKATTDFIAFCDNDLDFEPNWLEALEQVAVAEQADVIAPLIFIGPSTPPIIHHAGSDITAKRIEGELIVNERHRLSNARWPDVQNRLSDSAPLENDGFEFHCVMLRRSFLERMGGLDERMVSRDHVDVALYAKALDAKIVFAEGSHITYRAFDAFRRADDLNYFLFRWSDANVQMSLDAFEDNWDALARARKNNLRFGRKMRERAICSHFPRAKKLLGNAVTAKLFMNFKIGRANAYFADALTQAPAPKRATPPPKTAAEILE